MKKFTIIFFLLFIGVTTLAMTQQIPFSTEILEIQNKVCPVMGGKTSEKVKTVFNGKIYYFCCPGCIEMFKKDFEKYRASESLQGQSERLLFVTNKNGICPITKEKASLEFFNIFDDKITFYANEPARDKDKKNKETPKN